MAAPDGSLKRQASRKPAEKAKLAGSLPRRPSCWWSMPSCQQTRVAGRSAPVRCAAAAQLLVVHAQLLVGMHIRVFSL